MHATWGRRSTALAALAAWVLAAGVVGRAVPDEPPPLAGRLAGSQAVAAKGLGTRKGAVRPWAVLGCGKWSAGGGTVSGLRGPSTPKGKKGTKWALALDAEATAALRDALVAVAEEWLAAAGRAPGAEVELLPPKAKARVDRKRTKAKIKGSFPFQVRATADGTTWRGTLALKAKGPVAPAPAGPLAVAGAAEGAFVPVGTLLHLDAGASFACTGPIARYAWTATGPAGAPIPLSPDATSPQVTARADSFGTHTFRLDVWDEDDVKCAESAVVRVFAGVERELYVELA